jgi:hypothetical protein
MGIDPSKFSPRVQAMIQAKAAEQERARIDDSFKAHKAPKTQRSKYGNQRIEVDGERFDSKGEWHCCKTLRAAFGERNVWRQVAFLLPGGIVMKLDFLVRDEATGRVVACDYKGAPPTQDWLNKRKLIGASHGLEVHIIRRSDKPVEIIRHAMQKVLAPQGETGEG